jgi:hypothetical protein
MKATTIFADQNEDEKPKDKRDPKLVLSHDAYRKLVKEAYKEGFKDALQENAENHNTPAQDGALSEQKKQAKKEYRNRNLTPDQKDGVEEGEKEAVKEGAKRREETKQKLEAIAERHDVELLRATTVFPFTLFPDTIIIDTTKITIIRKQMFATEHITTIPLKDIADAQVQTALFLGTLTVAYMPQSTSPGMLKPVEDHITSLRRQDAIRAKNIIKGVLVAHSEGIDISHLEPEELVNVIEKFGTSVGVS